MGSRIVRPETTTLQISNGDWILVKKRLNHGEQQDVFSRRYIADPAGVRVNLRVQSIAKVVVYLLDWSLIDEQGKQLVIRDQAADVVEGFLNALDPDSFTEIHDAIERHEMAMDAERQAEKNGQGGANSGPVISPLPVAATGASSGSAN